MHGDHEYGNGKLSVGGVIDRGSWGSWERGLWSRCWRKVEERGRPTMVPWSPRGLIRFDSIAMDAGDLPRLGDVYRC